MRINRHNIYIILFQFALLTALSSCIDEPYISQQAEGSFINIKKTKTYEGTHPGTSEDYVVTNLRILAFDYTTGQCKSNVYYNASKDDIIQHPIDAGTYNLVFLANAPPYVSITNKLEAVTQYSDLDYIAYPEDAFVSERIIPMIQEVKNATILPNGKGIIVNSVQNSILELALNRMAVRVDVVLEGDDNFDSEFKGVSFSNLPDKVPLTGNYQGDPINRNVVRTFTVADNGNYFSTPTGGTSPPTWSKKITRVVLPSSSPAANDNTADAVTFTVNMHELYSPSCLLKITDNPDNYSLPNNTKLDLTGIIKEPLEVNIVASEWQDIDNDWNIAPVRILNVSHAEVNITDFNGARISFWSNMPFVRVDEITIRKSNNTEMPTNEVFNALSSQEWNPHNDERFKYSPAQGAGYMDILLDMPNEVGSETYEITLVASEDFEGTNSLKKKIRVHVKQEGTRDFFVKNSADNPWTSPYVGAFFRNNEVGERVISGNRYTYWAEWSAQVVSGTSFIKLSTTPSFDPNIGTNNPGNPEHYPVNPNSQKGETSLKIQGRGRIYFRIGMTGTNSSQSPRYGKINITYLNHKGDGTTETITTSLYVRQGEAPDYLMRSGSSDSSYGRKFAAFNLTATDFKNNQNTTAKYVTFTLANKDSKIDFVQYPSQSGAFFRWGFPTGSAAYAYYAYHPTNRTQTSGDWSVSPWQQANFTTNPLWKPATGTKMADYYEISPSDFERPSDGTTSDIATNSTSSTAYQSDWRMSLFGPEMLGNADNNTNTVANGGKPFNTSYTTSLYTPKILNNLLYGYYADGFFDRRPIQSGKMIKNDETGSIVDYTGVSLNTTAAAFRGVLVFNPSTNASLFLPAAGRRLNNNGSLEYAGQTGFYWSSSVAPGWTNIVSGTEKGMPYGNIWSMEFNYSMTKPLGTAYSFGYSIRCVQK